MRRWTWRFSFTTGDGESDERELKKDFGEDIETGREGRRSRGCRHSRELLGEGEEEVRLSVWQKGGRTWGQ